MKLFPAFTLALAALALLSVSAAHAGDKDGRKYYGGTTPVQGRMGVQYKRLKTPGEAPAVRVKDGSLFGSFTNNEPAGLLDRNEKPDEPGAQYWIHAQQSPNPTQSRMGVQVSRRKK